MKRHYYISNTLDDLDSIEHQLEEKGITRPQIHVLSHDDAGVDLHEHLHGVEAVLKLDVVRGTILGAIAGVLFALATLLLAEYSSLTERYTWTPFIFLAIVLLGFSTWFGGYHGIKRPHQELARFAGVLDLGKHVLFVDIDPGQALILKEVVAKYPGLVDAGTGPATPRWVVMTQQKTADMVSHTFP